MTDALPPTEQQRIQQLVIDQIETAVPESVPCFYGITGSFLYGTETPASDIDVRGFHCAPADEYILFDQPAAQHSTTHGTDDTMRDIDFTSYELREFGSRCLSHDFPVIEAVYTNTVILNELPTQIESLRTIINQSLPGQLPQRYGGMARSIYNRDIDQTDSRDRSTLKSYLYSLRGALAATYTRRSSEIEPDLMQLAELILDRSDRETVEAYIDQLQSTTDKSIDKSILTDMEAIIRAQIDDNVATQTDPHQATEYKTTLEEWMLTVRTETGTR